jgi:beta-phosphoglucomutase
MTKLKACLFDLDGVIVDTAHFHYIAWRELANKLGFDLSTEQNEELKGISRMESLDIILRFGNVQLSEETKSQLASEKNDQYLALCRQMTPDDVLPGVRIFLDSLREVGIHIGLGSASKNARLILDQIGMIAYFDTIVDGTRITKGKPDPETFLLGASDLGVLPEECLVFEDAVAGVQAAEKAGMKSIGVGDPAILTQADMVITSFKDVDIKTVKLLFN